MFEAILESQGEPKERNKNMAVTYSNKLTNEQRKSISNIKKELDWDVWENNEKVGKVSYNAYQAIQNNKLDTYTPRDENEKSVLDKYRERRASRLTDSERRMRKARANYEENRAAEPTDKSFGHWLGTNVNAGLAQVTSGLAKSFDLILPTEFLGRYDFVSNLNTHFSGLNEKYSKEAQKVNSGKGKNIGGQVLQGTVAALPNAILAVLAAPLKIGSTALSLSGTVAATGAKGAAQALGTAIKSMGKNPMYWSSFLQTVGNDYEDAKNGGANEFVALSSATLTSLLNAGIEVGGGIEALPKRLKTGDKKAIVDWVKSSIEEGGEEVVQGLITNGVAKLMYDKDRDLFNPKEAAKEFAMGTAVGGILGGGQVAINNTVINKVSGTNETGSRIRSADALPGIVSAAVTFDENGKAYKNAQSIIERAEQGKDVSDYQIGKLYNQMTAEIEKDFKKNNVNVAERYSGIVPTHYSADSNTHIKLLSQTDYGTYAAVTTDGKDIEVTPADLKKNYEKLTAGETKQYLTNRAVEKEIYDRMYKAVQPENADKNLSPQSPAATAPLEITRGAFGTGQLNSTIARYMAISVEMEKQASGFKAMTAPVTEKMAERGTADKATLRGYAQAVVEAMREKGNAGYAAMVTKTNNLSEALIEHSFGASSGYVTEALLRDANFLKISGQFKSAFTEALSANARYAKMHNTGLYETAMAQLEAVRGGDYSSLMSVANEGGYKHIYNENTVPKEFLDSVNKEIENAVVNIRNGNLDAVPDTIEVTKLSKEAVKKISDFVGFDINGYSCKIEKDRLVHIENRHGIEGEHDQSLSDPKDIARMGYVVNNSDNIEWVVDEKGNRVYDRKYNNKDNTVAPVMSLSSRIDGTYCVSQVAPDSKKKTLWITSARIEKADAQSQVPNDNNVTPQPTFETPLNSSSAFTEDKIQSTANSRLASRGVSPSDKNSISQPNATVNNSIRKKDENDTGTPHQSPAVTASPRGEAFGAVISETEHGYILRGLPEDAEMEKVANAAADGAVIELRNSSDAEDVTLVYDEGVSAKEIKNDISRYYNKGIIPKIALGGDLPFDDVRFSVSESGTNDFLTKLKKGQDKLKAEPKIFSVKKALLPDEKNASKVIKRLFDSWGGEAVNKKLGRVELTNIGAKSTVFHGITKDKLTAALGIKSVIENGVILSYDINWKNRGYDTYIISGKGDIDGQDVVLGVIVKSYPNGNMPNKFYLHDIIKTEAVSDAAAIESVTNVNETTSTDNIAQKNNIVNSSISENVKNDTGTLPPQAVPLPYEGRQENGRNADTSLLHREAEENGLQNNSFSDTIDENDIPYRERVQLKNYIMQKNNSSKSLPEVDCTEIGNNFYIWHNISKTEYKPFAAIPIEGNENLIDDLRSGIYGTNRSTSIVRRVLQEYRDGRKRNNSNNAMREGTGGYGKDDRFSVRQSEGNKGRYTEDGSDNIQPNEKGDTNNGQQGDISILRDGGRADNAGAGEQNRKLQSFERENQGKTEKSRKAATKRLLAEQKTRQEVIRTSKGAIRINVINADSFDADMRSVAESFADEGVETVLFAGRGEKAYDSRKKLKVDGFVIGKKVYIRYDGRTAPQKLKLHEMVHIRWGSPEIQAIREDIFANMTEEEQAEILNEQRYLDYANIYGDDVDAILEEFVADTLAGMNTYTEQYIDTVSEYWSGNETAYGYSANDYTESIDAGGRYSAESEEVKITGADISAVQSIGRKSVNDFDRNDIKKTEAFARRYFAEMGVKSPFFRAWFGDWRANDTSKVNVSAQKGSTRGVHKNTDTGWDIQVSGKVFNESRHKGVANTTSLPYLDYIDGIVENATLLDSYTISSGKAKSENSAMMHSMYALADVGNGTELIKLYVEELRDVNSNGTIKRSYQLQNLSSIKNQQLKVQSSGNNLSSIIQTADGYSVADLFTFVKQFDKNFNPKPVSGVVNEDGTPKTVYHGTERFGFTTFDNSKSDDKLSFFFTDDEGIASTYSGVEGVREISDKYRRKIEQMDNYELGDELNRFITPQDRIFNTRYEAFDVDSVYNREQELEAKLNELGKLLYNTDFSSEGDYAARHVKDLENALIDREHKEIFIALKSLYDTSEIFMSKADNEADIETIFSNLLLLMSIENENADEGIISVSGDGFYNRNFNVYTTNEARRILQRETQKGNYGVYIDVKNPLKIDCGGRQWSKIGFTTKNGTTLDDTRSISKYAKSNGYDGVILKDIIDNGGRNYTVEGTRNANVYIVFNSNQIKSATDNIGTFDKGNADIRYSAESENGLQSDRVNDIITDNFIYEADIPYRERVQLKNYIMQKNNSSKSFPKVDCKEIGDNFYVWHNISKTEYGDIMYMPIEGNEDIIELARSEIANGTYRGTENFNTRANRIRDGKGNGAIFNGDAEEARGYGKDDRLSVGQPTSNKRGYTEDGSDNIQPNEKVRFAISDDTDDTYLFEDSIDTIRNDIKEVMLKAETRPGKVYTTSDIRRVSAAILNNIDVGTGRGMSMTNSDKAAMMILTNRVLNYAKESDRETHIRRLASFIAQKARVSDSSDTFDYAGELRELKASVVHSIRLMPEDKATLDRIGRPQYKSVLGGGSMGVDAVYASLSEKAPDVFPMDTYATDKKLERIVDMYEFLKEGASRKSERLIDVLNQEDKRVFANSVKNVISKAFADSTLGRESKLSAETARLEANHTLVNSATEAELSEIEERHRAEIEELRTKYEKKIADMKKKAEKAEKEKVTEKGLEPKKRSRYTPTESFGEGDTGWSRPMASDREATEQVRTLPVSEIVDRISKTFDIPISGGNMTIDGLTGEYHKRAAAIRTRLANSLPDVCFEIGEHLNSKYKLSELPSFKKELSKILNAVVLDKNKGKSNKTIAASNFVRVYLSDMELAKQIAPNFYEEFRSRLSEGGVLSDLDAMAQIVSDYMNSTFTARVQAAIVAKEEKSKINQIKELAKDVRENMPEWMEDILTYFTDTNKAIARVSAEAAEKLTEDGSSKAEKAFNKIRGSQNAYIMATNASRASGQANSILTLGMTNLNGERTGEKSFLEAIKDVHTDDFELFDTYLVYKHSLEWLEPNDGSAKRVFADEALNDTKRIRFEIKRIERQKPHFKKAAENLYEFQRNLMKNFLVDGGGMTQEHFDKLNEMYPCYVPFSRTTAAKGIKAVTKNIRGGRGKFVNQPLPIKIAEGGDGEIRSPLESIMSNTHAYVKWARTQQVGQLMADYVDTIDGMGHLMERIQVGKQAQANDIESNLERNGGDSGNPMELADAIDLMISNDEKRGYTLSVSGVNNKKRIIAVYRNGEVAHYQVHDERLYRAMVELSPKEFGFVMKVSRAIMAPMKLLITAKNPIFAVSNFFRDLQTAYNNSDINNPVEFGKAYARAFVKIFRHEVSWLPFGLHQTSNEYQDYLAMGGGNMGHLSADRNMLKKAMREIYLKDAGKLKRAFSALTHIVSTISNFNDIIEGTPRFAEYLDTVMKTGDKQLALYKAQDLTVNFTRFGTAGRALNATFLYSNAAIQGLSKTVRSFTEADGVQRTARIKKYVFNAIISTALQMALARLWDDDEAYENLSAYTKNNFFNFAIGNGKFVSIPKAQNQGMLQATLERCVEMAMGNEDAFYNFGEYLALQLIPPFLPDDFSSLEDIPLSVARNTIFGSLIDIAVNEDFRGAPIVSGTYEDLPDKKQYNEKTTYTAYLLGQLFNQSPMKIDHLLSSNLGIIGQFNKALLPMGGAAQRDLTVGAKNKFIKDSYYSTDILNKAYEGREKAQYDNTLLETGDTIIAREKNSLAASYITNMNKAINNLPEEEKREWRGKLNSTIKNWDYELAATDKAIIESLGDAKLGEEHLSDTLPSADIGWSENKVEKECMLNPAQYEEFAKETLQAIQDGRAELIKTEAYKKADSKQKLELIKEKDGKKKSEVKKKYQKTIGGRK